MTDGNKNEVAYYEYDAWGNTMTQAGTWENPYRFSTKEWDKDSGLYYFGARYYSPEIGRWTQRDPAGIVDGLNLYVYLNNEPTNGVDPWGLFGQDVDPLFVMPLKPGTDTACGVYSFRAGVWGGNALVGARRTKSGAPKQSNYYIEIRPSSGTNIRFQFGHGGPSVDQGTTYRWKLKYNTYQRRDGELYFGRGKGKQCCKATCEDIHRCLDQASAAWSKREYKDRTCNCWHYRNALLYDCCLVMGEVIEERPYGPAPTGAATFLDEVPYTGPGGIW